jgi:hypothetical protein
MQHVQRMDSWLQLRLECNGYGVLHVQYWYS